MTFSKIINFLLKYFLSKRENIHTFNPFHVHCFLSIHPENIRSEEIVCYFQGILHEMGSWENLSKKS